jgi:hypothetical protein
MAGNREMCKKTRDKKRTLISVIGFSSEDEGSERKGFVIEKLMFNVGSFLS